MFATFSANTALGCFTIAVKITKKHTASDLRSDAVTVLLSELGPCGRIVSEGKKVRSLSDSFSEARCAKGWGYLSK